MVSPTPHITSLDSKLYQSGKQTFVTDRTERKFIPQHLIRTDPLSCSLSGREKKMALGLSVAPIESRIFEMTKCERVLGCTSEVLQTCAWKTDAIVEVPLALSD
jgi:hypothetical protein